MIHPKVGQARFAIILGLALAVFTCVFAQSSSSRAAEDGFRSDPRREAVEAEIYRTGLPGKLEDALGKSFGGVWFEPSTLQLHVGATSSESRRTAEAVAAQVGLAEHLTVTPVRSTWDQLERAQIRWRQRLADLFARREVMTSLAPDSNSVEIDLSSTAPSSRRTQIQQSAAADEVSASIDVLPASRFDTVPSARCAEFKTKAANCDPSIASGVTIKSQTIGGSRGDCTAGPLLIRKDRSTTAKATETFVLSAGHCFKYWGGNEKTWSAFNTKGEEQAIGKSVEHLVPGLHGTDAGVIKVESGYWAAAKDPPLSPTRAAWSAEKESEPVAVTKGEDPVKGTVSCISGQRSGIQCGTVESANTAIPMEYTPGIVTTLEGVAQLKLESGKAGKGDSGAPAFSQAAPGVIQGHNVAVTLEGGTEEGKVAYFQRLSFSLAKLPTGFELLTTGNETRHKEEGGESVGRFGSEAEHTVLTVGSNEMQKFSPTSGGLAIECTTMTADSATRSVKSFETLEFIPTHTNCETFLGAATSFKSNECKYVFRIDAKKFSGSTDIECPTGKVMEFIVGSICKYTTGTQTKLATPSYQNTGTGSTKEIRIAPNVSGVIWTRTTNDFFCPSGGTTGTYTGNFTLTGENALGNHVGVFVE
jgi:hypothetical protein